MKTNGCAKGESFAARYKARVEAICQTLALVHDTGGSDGKFIAFELLLTANWQFVARASLKRNGSFLKSYDGNSIKSPEHAIEVLERAVKKEADSVVSGKLAALEAQVARLKRLKGK